MTEQQERIANELENALNQFSENVKKILEEMFSFKGKTEKEWEMKCPYKYGDEYFFIDEVGSLIESRWDGLDMDKDRFSQGNIFPTKQATELEAKRRNLLTRFRAFRNEYNGDWKADWSKQDMKYFLSYSQKFDVIHTESICIRERFNLFGYFKNLKDAEKAIELFGDEIKELFVEV